MRYDTFALFYEHAEDTEPRYSVPMGIYHELHIGDLRRKGFSKDPDSTEGYLDYIKETSPEELQEYTHDGYLSELMDVIYSGYDFDRIVLQMLELEAIDDEGTLPPWGIMVNRTFVKFQYTEPFSPVVFIDGNPYDATENTRSFQVPLKRLKDEFDVLTTVEVIEKLKPEEGMDWEWEDFKHFFESTEVDAATGSEEDVKKYEEHLATIGSRLEDMGIINHFN